MAYTVLAKHAGLQQGETAVRLDTGDHVAVSVRAERNSNGSGSTFFVAARWVDAAGATMTDNNRQRVVTSASSNVPADQVARHGEAAYAREMLLLALGEEADAHVEAVVDLEAHAALADQLPAGFTADPTADRLPLLPLPAADRLHVSIVHAIRSARASGYHNPASLL